ncbi:MAG: cytochrome c3 family protein [Planctomycetota bacterium]|jgi:hypothetical protein
MPRERIRTIALACGLVLVLVSLGSRLTSLRVPGNHRGYSPTQPIAYSHRLHAGELEIDCLYCHTAAERGRHAGIPSAGVCMNCHQAVTATRATVVAEEKAAKEEDRAFEAPVSSELRKLYRALGLNDERKRDPSIRPRPIEWVRIHKVSDFVAFDHRSHVAAGVDCQECHGPVETMERVRQHATLLMGWCVDCHKERRATLDCGACHQ